MFKIILTFLLVACIAAFAPFARMQSSRMSLRACEDRYKDASGKCPGDAGFIPVSREAPEDFAAYQAQLKAKKAAKEAAEAAAKKK